MKAPRTTSLVSTLHLRCLPSADLGWLTITTVVRDKEVHRKILHNHTHPGINSLIGFVHPFASLYFSASCGCK